MLNYAQYTIKPNDLIFMTFYLVLCQGNHNSSDPTTECTHLMSVYTNSMLGMLNARVMLRNKLVVEKSTNLLALADTRRTSRSLVSGIFDDLIRANDSLTHRSPLQVQSSSLASEAHELAVFPVPEKTLVMI